MYTDANCSQKKLSVISVLEVCKQSKPGMWVRATVDENLVYTGKYYTDDACSQAVAEDVKPTLVLSPSLCNLYGSPDDGVFYAKPVATHFAESYTVQVFDDGECTGNVTREDVRAVDLCVSDGFAVGYHARSFCHAGSAYQFAFGGNDCDTGGVAGQGESLKGCVSGGSSVSKKQKDGAACPARPEDEVVATMSTGSCAVSMFMMSKMPYGTGNAQQAACAECWPHGGCPYDVLCSDTCANHSMTVECFGRDDIALEPFKAAVSSQTGKCSNIPAQSSCSAWKALFKSGKCCGMESDHADFQLCSYMKKFYKAEECCGVPSKTVSAFAFTVA